MKTDTYNLEFITPCFCAGADQGKAEIRPASIRGQLRWWFRVLGGMPEQEREAFGGVSRQGKKENPLASKLVVRVSDAKEGSGSTHLPKNLTFFTSSRSGMALPTGSRFRLTLAERAGTARGNLLQSAIEAFLLLGCIGLRSGRGLGAFARVDRLPSEGAVKESLRSLAGARIDCYPLSPAPTSFSALEELEAFVGEFRKKSRLEPNSRNAFGFVNRNQRHAATLRLRPVKVAEGFLPVVFYTERPLAEGMRGVRRELEDFFAGK